MLNLLLLRYKLSFFNSCVKQKWLKNIIYLVSTVDFNCNVLNANFGFKVRIYCFEHLVKLVLLTSADSIFEDVIVLQLFVRA